jgi:eukaryotic-like serine/threonine-protein kinase
MPPQRPPWWVLAIAASVLGYLALMTYADVLGPGAVGAGLRFRQGRVFVVEVVPGSPAAQAGLAPGDEVVTVNGLDTPSLLHWRLVSQNFEVGRPVRFDVRRGQERSSLQTTLGPHWQRFGFDTWLVLAAKLAAQLVTLGLGVLIAVRRPRDPVALVGACFLAALAVTDVVPLTAVDPHAPSPTNGALAIWRGLPAWLTPPLWIGATVFLMGPVLQVVFYGLFPRPLLVTRRAWLLWSLTWAPSVVVGVPRLLRTFYFGVYNPGQGARNLAAWTTAFVGAGVLAALATAVTLLVLNYRRSGDATERRRIRVVVVGYAVGMGVPAVLTMSGFFDLPPAVQALTRSPVARSVASVLFLLVPGSLAYGILRHRLLDVGTILRNGLQYAFARRVALSLVPACAALLLIDVAWHSDQPLRAVLQSRGWAYLAILALAGLVYTRRQAWLDALDRRFFRERYDAQRLIGEVVDEVRRATNLEGVSSRVVSRIESALHPEYVALLSRRSADQSYQVLASAPDAAPVPPLRPDSKMVGLVRLLGRPLDASARDTGWLKEQLPHEETAFLHDSRIGLIVPVALAPTSGHEALLVLGIKRSEEAYSREDQELLQAVGGGLAILADRPPASAPADLPPAAAAPRRDAPEHVAAFGECPRCGTCHDVQVSVCERDGSRLDLIRLPRELGGRYRLARRLGRGGMGSVYEGVDLSLGRRVAVKVIREDLVGSAEAAERFRREARASASVAHANVVTVYDFGVVAGTRGYLVMELLHGATLRELLRERGRLAPDETLAILGAVAAGVEAAHREQLVHRDLKPENIFLTASPHAPDAASWSQRVKVLDFGVARFLSSDARQTTTVVTDRPIGTLFYMGPEQLRGCPAEQGWDTWALAVMAYEMLAGTLPFQSDTAVDYQVAVLAARPRPISATLGPSCAALDAFFARALSPTPANRPSSATALVDGLGAALAGT